MLSLLWAIQEKKNGRDFIFTAGEIVIRIFLPSSL